MKLVQLPLSRYRAQILAALAVFVGLLAALPAGAGAAGPSTLEPSFEYPTSTSGIAESEIWGMDSGDLNGDGRADVVTASLNREFGPSWIGVQFAAADGSLAEPIAYTLPTNGALYVTLGDFDDDEDLDIVAIRDSGASLLVNDGDGGFGTELPIADSEYTSSSAAAGDFNRDGDLDLAISDGPEARIFLGEGDGSFEEVTPIEYEEESWGITIVSADFEGDGSADLAATQYDSGLTEVLTSDDDGTFTSRGSYGTPCGCGGPSGLTAADLDLDGDEDLVVAERWNNRIFSIMSGPDSTFTKGPNVNVPGGSFEANPIWIASGDMNGDGYPDVATADYMNDSVTSLVGNGSGSFTLGEVLYPPYTGEGSFSSHANVIDDFNADGRLDMAVGAQLGPVAAYVNDGSPSVTLEPASLDFGPQPTGIPSAPLTVHLENEGRAVLNLSGTSILGLGASAYAVDATDCTAAPALVGVGCDLEVTFTPSALGAAAAARLEIESNNPGADLKVELSGVGVTPTPNITLDPAIVDFGEEAVGSVSAPETITIGNDGSAALQVSGIVLVGDDLGEFDLDSASCGTATIAIGGECEFTVAFEPGSAGLQQVGVVIESDDPQGPTGIELKGVGTEPDISVEPAALEFPDQAIGSESDFVPFTIENEGDAALELDTIAKSGADALDFSVYSAECAATTLEQGESCKVWVSFRPSQLGERAATVTVDSNDAGGPLEVPLSGTGTGSLSPAEILVSPGLIGFGSREVGSASPSSTVTITNLGETPLSVGAVTLGGDVPGDFALGGGCPSPLAFGESCEISVSFTAAAAGARSATLTIASSATGAPASVALSGTGVAPVVPPAPAPAPAPVPAPAPAPAPISSYSKKPPAQIKTSGNVVKQVQIAFKSNQAGSTFQCSLDGKAFASCHTPLTLKNVKLGQHTFKVRSVNSAGTVGAALATKFKVVKKS